VADNSQQTPDIPEAEQSPAPAAAGNALALPEPDAGTTGDAMAVPPPRPRRHTALGRLIRFGRIALALALLAFVLSKLQWREVAGYAGQIQLVWLLLFLAITPILAFTTVEKWRLLLRARGKTVGFGRLFALFMVGQFYNIIFPATIGGDTIRSVGVNRDIHAPKIALASVLVDRFTGATILVLMGIAVLIASPAIRSDELLTIATIAGMGMYVAVMAAVLHPRIVWLGRLTLGRLKALTGILDKLERFQVAMHQYRHHPRALAAALAWSVVFNVGAIIHVYLACRTLGGEVPGEVTLWGMAQAVPVILLVALLPLTPGGHGVVHWAYYASFLAVGMNETLGVCAAFLIVFKQALWTAGGYGVYTALGVARPEDIRPAPVVPPTVSTPRTTPAASRSPHQLDHDPDAPTPQGSTNP